MKKWTMVVVLLFCGTYLFAQNFFDVVRMGTPEQVQAAITAGVEINGQDEDGRTPLMLAAWFNGNPDVITTLLNAGAKIDERDKDGMTPLMMAASNNKNSDIIITLLNAGADATLEDYTEKTALVFANENSILKGTPAYEKLKGATLPKVATTLVDIFKTGTPEQVQAAITAGVEINGQDEDGRTPLMWAAEFNNNPDVLIALLDAGAEINARDESGWTPLMYAARNNENLATITTRKRGGV